MANTEYTTAELLTEEWVPCYGAPLDYAVSSLGRMMRIRSVRGHQIGMIRPQEAGRGYLMYHVLGRCVQIQRVVLLSFVGAATPPRTDAAHHDGNPRNNRLANLRWATRKENMADSLRHGTRVMGSRVSWSKLTEPDIHDILKDYACGCPALHLADRYGVSKTTICAIVEGTIWAHVDSPYRASAKIAASENMHKASRINGARNRKTSDASVSEIRRRFSGGESAASIARSVGISYAVVYAITRGKIYAHDAEARKSGRKA